MFIMRYILILFIPNILVTCSRIIDRFGGRYRQDIPCRLSMLEEIKLIDIGPFGVLRKAWIDSLARINCTLVYDPYDDTGFPDENGTYNGYIGRVQRGESDIFGMFFRPDSLPFEPGLIGPVMYEADEAIFSRKNYSKPIEREIISFVQDFDEVLYSHVAFALYFFSVTYAAVEWILSRKKGRSSVARQLPATILIDDSEDDLQLTDLFYSYLEILKESFMALIDQMNLNPEWWSSKLLTLCFSTFILILIPGIVCNVIGSNLIVNLAPSQIDSVSWFTNDSWTRPVVLKKMFLLNLLKSSVPGTPVNHLWQVVMSNPNVSLVDANMEKGKEEAMQKMLELVEEINSWKKALIAPRFMLDVAIRWGCVIRPELLNHAHISQESIAEGIMTPLMSHKIHPYVREYFEYMMMTTCLEMGLARTAFSLMDQYLPLYMPGMGSYGITSLKCQERKHSSPSDWRAFKIADLRSIFMISFSGGAAALIFSVLERIIHRINIRLANRRTQDDKPVLMRRRRRRPFVPGRPSIGSLIYNPILE